MSSSLVQRPRPTAPQAGLSASASANGPRADRGQAASFATPPQGSFRKSLRFGVVLVPLVLLLVVLGGTTSLLTLALGAMAVYVMDAARLEEPALLVWWLTMTGVWAVTLLNTFAAHGLNWFLLLAAPTLALVMVCLGLWGSLHFSWFEASQPMLVLFIERFLHTNTLVPASTVTTWLLISSCPPSLVSPLVCMAVCAMYAMFSLPAPSSFHRAHADNAPPVLGKVESFVHTLFLLSFPAIVYVALNHHLLLPSATYLSSTMRLPLPSSDSPAYLNLMALVAVPLLWLSVLAQPKFAALWWLDVDEGTKTHFARLGGVLSSTSLGLWFELRVVFGSYRHHIALTHPLSYVCVTVGVYGTVLAIALHVLRLLPRLGLRGVEALLQASFLSLAVSFGAPWPVLIGQAVATHLLAAFYFDKSLLKYVAFAVASSVAISWFCFKTFFSIDFTFPPAQPPSLPLLPLSSQGAAVLLVVAFVLCVLCPGLAIKNDDPIDTPVILLAHALVMAVLEHTLHHGTPPDCYPHYLVVFTSCVGLAVTRHLIRENRIPSSLAPFVTSAYAAKLGCLLPSAAAPFALYFVVALLVWGVMIGRFQAPSPLTFLSYLSAAFVAAYASLDTVVFPILSASYGRSVVEAPSLRLAALLVVWGVVMLPMTSLGGVRFSTLKRWNVFVVCAGVVVGAVQPELDVGLLVDSVSVTLGTGHTALHPSMLFKPLWADWALVCAVLIIVGSVLQLVPQPKSLLLRSVAPLTFGVALGLTVCARYLAPVRVIYVIFCTAVVLCTLFTYLCVVPSVAPFSGVRYFVFCLMETALPMGYVALSLSVPRSERVNGPQLLYSTQLVYVCTHLVVHVCLALYLKLKVSSFTTRAHARAKHDRRSVAGAGAGSFDAYDIGAHAHTATLLNFLTLMAFLLAVLVNGVFVKGTTSSIFFLAPLLLCLHQDPQLLPHLTDQKRYFPIIFASTLAYVLVSVYSLGVHVLHSHLPDLVQSGQALLPSAPVGFQTWTTFDTLKNLALLLLTLPPISFLNAYLWNFQRQSDMTWFVCLPLALLPCFAADVSAVRYLGAMAVVGGVMQVLMTWHMQARGHSII